MQLFLDRSLCERVVPGNRVLIHGIYSIRKTGKPGKGDNREKATVGVRAPYMRVVGITVDSEGTGAISRYTNITTEEEEKFRRLAAQPDIYERLSKSLAPSIFGSIDIKKAITCLLFGGARKRMPDGLTRRGDINVLLLGDPGTAKSQLLKFVEKVAPIAVYTSGKGSSAAGLTASVMRDPATVCFNWIILYFYSFIIIHLFSTSLEKIPIFFHFLIKNSHFEICSVILSWKVVRWY